jgi:uncharacterized protein DUF6894
MAIYYFHLCDGTDVLLDPEGRELDRSALAGAALAEARAIVAADAETGHIDFDQHIEVRDAAGAVVHRIAFAEAVRVTSEGTGPH